jgi:hypothetical protein
MVTITTEFVAEVRESVEVHGETFGLVFLATVRQGHAVTTEVSATRSGNRASILLPPMDEPGEWPGVRQQLLDRAASNLKATIESALNEQWIDVLDYRAKFDYAVHDTAILWQCAIFRRGMLVATRGGTIRTVFPDESANVAQVKSAVDVAVCKFDEEQREAET